jgi:di/tripeptidase
MECFCTFDGALDKLVDKAVGSHRYRVTVRTEGGHSFSKFGNANAIEKLAGIVSELYRIQVPENGKTTYNVGMISGGTSVNTIAQEAWMLYEFRSDCRENLAYMENCFESVIAEKKAEGLDVSYELLGLRPCEGEVDPEKKRLFLERASRAVSRVTGTAPKREPGSTDCNIPLSIGIPSVCIGCYRGAGAHTREEYIEIDSLKQGYEVVFEMIFGR